MSKAARQSLIMLSCVSGVFNHLHNKRYFARVDIHRMCKESAALTVDIMKRWWQHDDDVFDTAPYIERWFTELKKAEHTFSSITLVFLASRIVADLQFRVSNPNNIRLLSMLDEPIKRLEDFVDPTSSNWIEMDKGNSLMDRLYDMIGWEWEDAAKKKRLERDKKRAERLIKSMGVK